MCIICKIGAMFNKQVAKVHLYYVHLYIFICQIVYIHAFLSLNIIYKCRDVSILK